ncbi:MAG: serine protease [Gammaproteobacteria bacterium]
MKSSTTTRARHGARYLLLLPLLALGACTTNVAEPTATATSVTALPTVRAAFHFESQPQQCDRPNNTTLSSVVRVATTDGSDASGVVIAYDRVLTAAHVVDDNPNALVYINGSYRPARVMARDLANDLALLSVNTQQLEPIRISSNHLFSAEPVWTVGFPLAMEQTANYGRYQQHVNGAIHSSASTNAGASGGGLLRCASGAFELAGMIRGYGAYWDAGELRRIEDLSISVPADTISNFAVSAGISL